MAIHSTVALLLMALSVSFFGACAQPEEQPATPAAAAPTGSTGQSTAPLPGGATGGTGAATVKPTTPGTDPNAGTTPPATEPTTEPVTDPKTDPPGMPSIDPTLAILMQACGTCHGLPQVGGAPTGFVLSSFEAVGDQLGARALAGRILARVDARTMPPGGVGLTDADRAKLIAWANLELAGPTTPTTDPSPEPTNPDPTDPTPDPSDPTPDPDPTPPNPVPDPNPQGPAPDPASIVWAAPIGATETADASYAIQLTVDDVGAAATYALFSTTVSGATTGGSQIVANVANATTSVTWNTSGGSYLDATKYYVYVVVTDGATTTRSASPQGVTIHRNHAPTVTIDSQPHKSGADGMLISDGSSPISFTASDSDGDAMTYKIELLNNGSVVATLANFLTYDGNAYDWNPTGVTPGINYKIRITMKDVHGLVGTAVSSASAFGIAAGPLTYNDYVQPLLTASCSCHAPGGSQAANMTINYGTATIGVFAKRNNIRARSAPGGGMPAVGVPHTALLQRWIDEGAPEN